MPDEIWQVIRESRAALAGAIAFSGATNVLALTGSLYMMQVYDRVVPSRSIPTLAALTALMIALYAALGALDFIRGRLLARVGLRAERALRDLAFNAVLQLPLRARNVDNGMQPVADLEQIRAFLSGQGPIAIFDMPWLPLYLLLLWMLHPLLGILGIASMITVVALMALTEVCSRRPTKMASVAASARAIFGEATRRNAHAITVMGMTPRMSARWSLLSERVIAGQNGAADISARIGTLSRTLRMILQSGMLGLGAYLVINNEASAGVMIASSIAMSRALAPIDSAIANWRAFIAARQAAVRLKAVFTAVPAERPRTALPLPHATLTLEELTIAAPANVKPLLQNVSLTVRAGQAVGIIGPSGAGKSSLAQTIVGAWLPLRGKVRLDGAPLDQWPQSALGRCIGYLPQNSELLAGTIAENIARFCDTGNDADTVAAARAAGVHELILTLPDGYDTYVGDGGLTMSAGQRQRIALARALYGNPFLVVLDEPNSNLDAEGDTALTQAIISVRLRGGIALIVAHRPSALVAVDQVLVIGNGRVVSFGPKDEILAGLNGGPRERTDNNLTPRGQRAELAIAHARERAVGA